jgi:membrane peptidoglycan carboxypeptidase
MPIPTTPNNLPSLKKYFFDAYQELSNIEDKIAWVGWHSELSCLEQAVVLLEDRRYYSHAGIDLRSVFRETFKKITFRRHGGASTIEMQFVRTCTGYKELTLRRKVFEMFLAWALLHRANKLEILRSYLEIAYFGTGIRGQYQASTLIFGKLPEQLTETESYQLASMLVYPRPRIPSQEWLNRVNRRATYGMRLFTKIGGVYLK